MSVTSTGVSGPLSAMCWLLVMVSARSRSSPTIGWDQSGPDGPKGFDSRSGRSGDGGGFVGSPVSDLPGRGVRSRPIAMAWIPKSRMEPARWQPNGQSRSPQHGTAGLNRSDARSARPSQELGRANRANAVVGVDVGRSNHQRQVVEDKEVTLWRMRIPKLCEPRTSAPQWVSVPRMPSSLRAGLVDLALASAGSS